MVENEKGDKKPSGGNNGNEPHPRYGYLPNEYWPHLDEIVAVLAGGDRSKAFQRARKLFNLLQSGGLGEIFESPQAIVDEAKGHSNGKKKASSKKGPKFDPNGPIVIPDRYLPHIHAMWEAMDRKGKKGVVAGAQGILQMMLTRQECPETTTVNDIAMVIVKAKPSKNAAEAPTGKPSFADLDPSLQRAHFAKEIGVISGLLQVKDIKQAKSKAADLSGIVVQAGGKMAAMTPVKVMEIASNAVKAKASNPADVAEDEKSEITTQQVNKTNWSNVGKVYDMDDVAQEAMKGIAKSIAKFGKESSNARKEAKEFVEAQKQSKAKFKFKNNLHAVDAIEQAVRMKANGEKLSKPLKSRIKDNDS
jgi:hypothetical protein